MNACTACGAPLGESGACRVCGRSTDVSQAATLASSPETGTSSPSPIGRGSFVGSRYRVLDLLGRGAMGEVYRVEDLELGEEVALKLLPEPLSNDRERRQMLRREVSLARRVSHPSVCRVHDVGEADGRLYLTMELVAGEDLATLLSRIGRLPPEKALEIGRQVTAGLAAAHAAGVLHRDLKPANVMLDRKGNARLSDFGLAVAGAARQGELVGTPRYMAPEQLRGGAASERSDLYALGLLLYELVTGTPAHPGRSLEELRRMTAAPPPRPSELVPGLDGRTESTILQCLAEDPSLRPATALAVLTALSGGDGVQAAVAAGQTPSPSAVADVPRTGALRPAIAWACLGAVVLVFTLYHARGHILSILECSRLELPSDALAVRARELADRAGHAGPWRAESWGLAYDRAAFEHYTREPDRDALAAARPAAIVFWYRASRHALAPAAGASRVAVDSPPPGPGEVVVRLDPKGAILKLAAWPEAKAARAVVSPADLPREAGLDPAHLAPAEPQAPPVWADTLVAWRSTAGDGLRLDVALRDGRVVHLARTRASDAAADVATRGASRFAGYPDLLTIAALALSAFLARENFRRRRLDGPGAFRVAAVTFGLLLAGRLLGADHFADFGAEARLLAGAMERALYYAAATWLLYVALEPLVRRTWPEQLVSWTRLLDGRFRDAMVGRDVLVGIVVADLSAAAMIVALTAGPGTPPFVPVEYRLNALLGHRFVLAALLYAAVDAITTGLVCLVLLLGLRLLPVPRWLGAAALALVLSGAAYGWLAPATEGPRLLLVALALLVGVSWVVVLVRFGVLAMASGMFLELFAQGMPNATRLTGWTSGAAWATLLVSSVLTLWAFRTSLGRGGRDAPPGG